MQITRGMRLAQAKEHVAGRLGVSPLDLADPIAMAHVRSELRLGRLHDGTEFDDDPPSPMESKMRIAALLDIPIGCVGHFREQIAGL